MVAVLPVDAVPPVEDVVLPVGQFVQLVAPAVASLAGASTYLPVAQASHAAATEASSLNCPAPQLLQMLAPDAVPPMEDLPAPHVVQAAPLDEILPTTQSMQVLVAVPTAADFPAAQFVQPAPSNETFPTGHATQSVTLVPAPVATEVPAAHFVHSVAPAVASLAGALAYIPVAQFSQAAATEASALNFPPLQLLHVLAPATTPPIDDVPAAHVLH